MPRPDFCVVDVFRVPEELSCCHPSSPKRTVKPPRFVMAFVVVVALSAPWRGPDGKAFSEYEAPAGFLAKPDVNALLF